MMCEVVSVELKGEGLTDDARAQRDDFLDDLYEHMHDLSAYVRHKVSIIQSYTLRISVLGMMCELVSVELKIYFFPNLRELS